MTYDQKLKKVMARLDSDGADSEEEWAIGILKAIGITRETPDGNEPPIIAAPVAAPPVIAKSHPNIPMPCCERAETRTKDCFVPVSEPDPDNTIQLWTKG